MLSHCSLVLSGVRARKQWREPRSGSLNIWVPDVAILTGNVTLGQSLPPLWTSVSSSEKCLAWYPWPRHAKFSSPELQNPNPQPLTPSGSSHCPGEPGHRPGIRLEVSPPGDSRAGARRAQGPPRTDTFLTEERPGPRSPGALDSTSHPDLAFRPALQLAKPAGPDLSSEIPQELHCLQQRASRVLAG